MLEEVIEYIQYNGENINEVRVLAGYYEIYANLSLPLECNRIQWCLIKDVHDCRKNKIIHRGDYIVRDANGVQLMTASEFQQKYGEVE